jgi:ADP-heptose:LPS heptosyltransferase
VKEIQAGGFRIAVVLQSQARIALAVLAARVRYRVGPLSKPHSYLTYNRGIRQRRSNVEMHETDYNLQLLRRLGIRVGTRNVETSIHLSDETRARGRQWLEEQGWKREAPLVAVHPGMGGSALNWPEPHYVELIRNLLKDGRQVLVTGGPAEGSLLVRIRDALGAVGEKAYFYGLPGAPEEKVDLLAGIFNLADLVIAPSTGPLHLAVALGKPVVTFYPPIRVQSALRWGPYLRDDTRASVIVPEVYCGEEFRCRGTLCNYYPCMKSLTITQALEQANFHLAREQQK